MHTAAGKSTFVRLLERASDEWEVIPEPIAKWCNVQTTDNECEVTKHKSSERNRVTPPAIHFNAAVFILIIMFLAFSHMYC